MNFAVRLSCVLVMVCCLSSTGNAGAIDRDRQRLQELQAMSERNSNPNAQVEITYETVEIYKKYRGQEESDAAKETEINTKVGEFESKIEIVEGVPKQGGGFLNWLKGDIKKPEGSQTQIIVTKVSNYLLGKLFEKLKEKKIN